MTRTSLYALAPLAILAACTPPQPLDTSVSFRTISCKNEDGKWSASSSEYKAEAVETINYRLIAQNQSVIRGPNPSLRKYSDCTIFDANNFYCLQDADKRAIFNVKKGHLVPMCESESQCTSELSQMEFYRLKLLSYFDKQALDSYCESKALVFGPLQVIQEIRRKNGGSFPVQRVLKNAENLSRRKD